VLSAAGWREFWRSRGMAELRRLLAEEWPPLAGRDAEEVDACAFRVASLLGSRASATALADELGRIRAGELATTANPPEDAETARRIAHWFASAAA
jgi:hypothetical protein